VVAFWTREDRLGSGVSTPPPLPASPYGQEETLSQALAPLQSFTDAHRMACSLRPIPFGRKRKQRNHAFSRGFLPFSVLPVAGSHLIPVSSQPTGYVSPSGFRTLSALCSPHDLPGLFHPGPAHGLCPSRFSSSDAVPYALSSAAPLLRLTLPSKEEVSTSGVNTLPRVPNAGPGFSQVTASDTSMGFFPFEASCQYR